ncbi:hypothetical protein BDP27DRAFT_1419678 [Rhodocollybia butyracea]|uniref:Uncharacterized protein n=1 Tax=Rhodocollybia butyracea TaxID=206335 RepID=A0A9P5U979_9AGAR|nr:hypothetical protein BDP27DRAFT_1419678 [Rhodocollybia butyracea]
MARLHLTKAQLSKDISSPSLSAPSASNAFPHSPRSKSPSKRNARPILLVSWNGVSTLPSGTEEDETSIPADPFTQLPQTPHARKRLVQQLRWETEVLPMLVRPYMDYQPLQ